MPRAQTAVVALLVAATLAACAAKSPEERVAAARARYEAKLTSFVVRRPEVPPPPAPAGEDAAEPAAEPGAIVDPVQELPTTVAVLLDVVVRRTGGRETLPGLTLDVEQIDPAGKPKKTWRVWVDTSGVGRGPGTQIGETLADVDYEEGDGFSVEVRAHVPPAERGEYREFAEGAR